MFNTVPQNLCAALYGITQVQIQQTCNQAKHYCTGWPDHIIYVRVVGKLPLDLKVKIAKQAGQSLRITRKNLGIVEKKRVIK